MSLLAVVGCSALVASDAAAAGKGTIAGRVINESTGQPQGGVAITLSGAREDGGDRIERRAVTDSRGRYRFDGLPTGGDRFYALDASYEDGLFAGGAISLPDNTAQPPVIRTTIKVWETTTDPRSILIRRDDIFAIEAEEGAVGILESVTIANQSSRAYIGRASRTARSEDPPSLGFALPSGADRGGITIVESDLDIPRIVEIDSGFAATIAIPPGEFRTTFSYSVPNPGGTADLSRVALYPSLEVNVFAAPPLEIRSDRLERAGEVQIGEGAERRSYAKWRVSETLEAGDPLQMIAVATSAASPLLYAGVVVAIAGAVALFVAVVRRGRPRGRSRTSVRNDPGRSGSPARHETLAAIAALDLRHQTGEISDDEWASRRAALKARLPSA